MGPRDVRSLVSLGSLLAGRRRAEEPESPNVSTVACLLRSAIDDDVVIETSFNDEVNHFTNDILLPGLDRLQSHCIQPSNFSHWMRAAAATTVGHAADKIPTTSERRGSDPILHTCICAHRRKLFN